MKIRYLFIFLLISLLLFFLSGCNNNDNNINETNSINANRLNAEISLNNTITNSISESTNKQPIEEELASFSTKLGGKNSPRSRNIGITTSILNETIVENGEVFSFCDTIGKPTADKGYEEADSFDKDGKTVKTLGGGNCQVSSTLYNVVLAVQELEVIERHAHVKPVHYVEKDKDATVSYGSVDFKFKNNTGSKIKIYANSDLNSVNIRIVKIQ